MSEAPSFVQDQGLDMLELPNSLAVSMIIFFFTFAAAISGMVLAKKLPEDHLNEVSRDVIKLVMGLIATMAALVLGLLIASANSSYQTQSNELQQTAASIIELDGVLAHYGPEASESRQRLRDAVAAAANTLWPKDGVLPQKQVKHKLAESAFYDSIANPSPHTNVQHFIQNRALATSASLRQMRALMLEQMAGSIPWPFLAVLIFWISMLFLGFGLSARMKRNGNRCFLDRSAFRIEFDLPDNRNESALSRIDASLRRAPAQRADPDRRVNTSRCAGTLARAGPLAQLIWFRRQAAQAGIRPG
jgi:hypothetical protein